MKLAFISTTAGAPWGGSEHLWFETAKLALQKKHTVFTSTYFWEKKPDAIKELTQLGAVSHFRPRYNPSLSVRLYNRLKKMVVPESAEIKALKTFDPDCILLNQSGGYDIIHRPELQMYLLTSGKRYFVICHNYNEDFVLSENDRTLLRRLYSQAACVFMICRPQADAITKQIVSKLPNLQLVDNPLNLKELGIVKWPAEDAVQFASVATFHVDRKGQDLLLEVLGAEKWKQRNWQLNLYGEGPHKKYVEELVIYFGLEDRVVFRGHVKDINTLWEKNHLLLLSSRIETGPMVLTESMLCGRPAVTTPVGRVNDLIKDNYNGFVAGAATVSFFDEALERAWQQKEHWAAIGANAYHTAINTIDLNAAASFLNLLTEQG